MGAEFINLQKAFNMVNHSLLFSKMPAFYFSFEAISWFTSYLHSCAQCVEIDQDISEFLNIKKGIPQGSIHGPLLFSFFINNLPLHCSGASCQLYSDNAVRYAPAWSPEQTAEVLSNYM